MTFEIAGMYLGVGLLAGVLSGLLGIGGGVVLVPMLIFCLAKQAALPEHIMHIALGTSLASIIFTSVSSFMAHHKRGAVQWNIVKSIAPGILTGTFFGSFIASYLSTGFLKIFFCIFLYIVATRMLMIKQEPQTVRNLPGTIGMFSVGSIIGTVSALVGIGGGSLSVPFMTRCNIPAHKAIGTSAAIGFPIAISGAFGYIVNNLHISGLPAHSLGFVYLPALAAIICGSVLTAPLGARLAHSLPVNHLKRIFSVFLYITATRMIWGFF